MTTPEQNADNSYTLYDIARDAAQRAKETRETSLKVFERIQKTMDDATSLGGSQTRASAQGQRS